MSNIPVYSSTGQAAGEVELADALLTRSKSPQVVNDAVTAYRANQRMGTGSTKTRSEVKCSGRKPWKQKGSGNARAGTRASPIWRGGGVALGPRPRDFSKKLTRKAARLAFRQAFTEKVQAGAVRVVDELGITEPKTKALAGVLDAQGLTGKILLVVDTVDKNIYLAGRNLANAEVSAAKDINVYQVLRYPNIVISKAGLEALQARLEKQVGSAS